MRLLKRVGTVAGIVLTILGLGGLADDLETWQRWVATGGRALGGDLGRWILVLLGVGLVVFSNWDAIRRRWGPGRGAGEGVTIREPRPGLGTRPPRPDWVTPEELDAYIESLKDVVEKHGFGREPPSALSEVSPLGRKRKTMAPRLDDRKLDGRQRDELRDLIREGEQLQEAGAGALQSLPWERSVEDWLRRHGLAHDADGFRTFQRSPIDQLVQLRLIVMSHIPSGLSADLTEAEALDRWMEANAIPAEDRPAVRKRSDEIKLEVAKGALSLLISEGEDIRRRVERRGSLGPLRDDAEEWATRTSQGLRTNFGEAYAQRFLVGDGLTRLAPDPPEELRGAADGYVELWQRHDARLRRLRRIAEEIKPHA